MPVNLNPFSKLYSKLDPSIAQRTARTSLSQKIKDAYFVFHGDTYYNTRLKSDLLVNHFGSGLISEDYYNQPVSESNAHMYETDKHNHYFSDMDPGLFDYSTLWVFRGVHFTNEYLRLLRKKMQQNTIDEYKLLRSQPLSLNNTTIAGLNFLVYMIAWGSSAVSSLAFSAVNFLGNGMIRPAASGIAAAMSQFIVLPLQAMTTLRLWIKRDNLFRETAVTTHVAKTRYSTNSSTQRMLISTLLAQHKATANDVSFAPYVDEDTHLSTSEKVAVLIRGEKVATFSYAHQPSGRLAEDIKNDFEEQYPELHLNAAARQSSQLTQQQREGIASGITPAVNTVATAAHATQPNDIDSDSDVDSVLEFREEVGSMGRRSLSASRDDT